MPEIVEYKASENNGNKVKKRGSKGIAWLSVLSGIQFILIIILFAQMDEHNHWDYASERHSHSSSDVAYHDHDYADSYHSHNAKSHDHDYADSYHSHNAKSHEHSAKDIGYQSFEYGGYGTLQLKLSEIDDKAEKNHTHNSFEIIGVADVSHTHVYAEIYHWH